jgi:hypothetical protein
MRLLSSLVTVVFIVGASMSACGGSSKTGLGNGGPGGEQFGNGNGNGPTLGGGDGGGGGGNGVPTASVPCPPGLKCNVSCSAGSTTTITGKVYDPAGKNGLYNVAV